MTGINTINTACPYCNAPHAKKLSLIYIEGISTMNSSIQSVGETNTIGKIKIKTSGTATGIQQSEVSKHAAPPETPNLVTEGAKLRNFIMLAGMTLAILFSGFAIVTDAKFFNIMVTGFGTFFCTLFGAMLVDVKPTEMEMKKHEEMKNENSEYDNWNRTFLCMSCGNKFIPISN